MPPKGIPLSPEERSALLAWVLEEDARGFRGVATVAEECAASEDSVANWIAGICAPFRLAHDRLARRLRARMKGRATA